MTKIDDAAALPADLQKQIAENPDGLLAKMTADLGAAAMMAVVRRAEMIECFGECGAHIRGLQREVAELREHVASMVWRGIWNPTTQFRRGNFCTSAGSLWLATANTLNDRPGTSSHWKLFAKRGGSGPR